MHMVLLILLINITYVSLFTIRTMFIFKGKRYLASLVSAAEAFIFVLGIGLVLDNLGETQNLVAYAVGFALGILVGTKIEQYLALGYVTVKVISKQIEASFPKMLRLKGFGVTSWLGDGRDGKRRVMEILTSRKDQPGLYNHIVAYDPQAFIISHEPQSFKGGFWVKNLKKYCKRHGKCIDHPFEDNLPGMDFEAIKDIQATKEYDDDN